MGTAADPPAPPVGSAAGAESDTYWELEADLHPQAEELWGLFCYERGALGAEIVEDSAARHVVRHAFAGPPDAAAWVADFARAYPHLPPPRLSMRRQVRQDWESAWRAHFTALRLSPGLLIVPPWQAAPDEAAATPPVRIVIDPGQGFGTGWHPSTALALLELEACLAEAPAPPARLLDVGTGSGILTIAGRLLGVPAAVALDVDERALPEVRHNCALSGLPGPPGLLRARPDCLRAAFPLVLANIVAEVLLAHCDDLAALTAPGGCLILSGILAQERAVLVAAYRHAGLRLEHERRREGWIALRLRRA